MKRFAWISSTAIALWVLVSFTGTMFDPANAELWTQSLMVSLLVSLTAVPALLLFGTQSGSKRSARQSSASTRAARQAESTTEAAEPFVRDATRPQQTLWPQTREREEA